MSHAKGVIKVCHAAFTPVFKHTPGLHLLTSILQCTNHEVAVGFDDKRNRFTCPVLSRLNMPIFVQCQCPKIFSSSLIHILLTIHLHFRPIRPSFRSLAQTNWQAITNQSQFCFSPLANQHLPCTLFTIQIRLWSHMNWHCISTNMFGRENTRYAYVVCVNISLFPLGYIFKILWFAFKDYAWSHVLVALMFIGLTQRNSSWSNKSQTIYSCSIAGISFQAFECNPKFSGNSTTIITNLHLAQLCTQYDISYFFNSFIPFLVPSLDYNLRIIEDDSNHTSVLPVTALDLTDLSTPLNQR